MDSLFGGYGSLIPGGWGDMDPLFGGMGFMDPLFRGDGGPGRQRLWPVAGGLPATWGGLAG